MGGTCSSKGAGPAALEDVAPAGSAGVCCIGEDKEPGGFSAEIAAHWTKDSSAPNSAAQQRAGVPVEAWSSPFPSRESATGVDKGCPRRPAALVLRMVGVVIVSLRAATMPGVRSGGADQLRKRSMAAAGNAEPRSQTAAMIPRARGRRGRVRGSGLASCLICPGNHRLTRESDNPESAAIAFMLTARGQARAAARLPDSLDPVGVEGGVDRHDPEPLRQGLRREHAVERIPLVEGYRLDERDVGQIGSRACRSRSPAAAPERTRRPAA